MRARPAARDGLATLKLEVPEGWRIWFDASNDCFTTPLTCNAKLTAWRSTPTPGPCDVSFTGDATGSYVTTSIRSAHRARDPLRRSRSSSSPAARLDVAASRAYC